MATFRSIQTSFWTDSWVVQLTPEQKYFYIYLLTNNRVSQCGIYEISLGQIAFETGYNKDTIEKLLKIFETKKKIIFSIQTSEICIINFSKYNFNSSPKVRIHIISELDKVKDRSLIQYLYGIDTIYKGYIYPIDTVSQEKEKEKEEKKEKPLSLSLDRDRILEIFIIEKNYPLEEFEKFINHYSRTGWVDKNGVKITDKEATARNWTQISTPPKYHIAPAYFDQWKEIWTLYKERIGFERAKHLLNIKPQISKGKITFMCGVKDRDICEENIDFLRPLLINVFGPETILLYTVPNTTTQKIIA